MTERSNNSTYPYHLCIDRYLREHFKKLVPGVFARWWGEPVEYSYAIRSMCEHEASQYFSPCTLVRVCVEEDFLWRKLRGGGSEGIFAVRDDQVTYLTPDSPNSVERALGGGVALRALLPDVLARLCCEVLLSRPDAHYSVISSSHEIEAWYPESRGYVLNKTGMQGSEHRVGSPRWQQDDLGVSALVFSAFVAGFRSYQVRCITLNLPPEGGIDIRQEVIIERVFERTPLVRV